MKAYKLLTPGMVIRETDEILYRTKWYPAIAFSVPGTRWKRGIRPVRRKLEEEVVDKNVRADARLIAAAPALLEALHTDLKRVNELSSMIPEQAGMWDMWARDIQNAIAKAGEPLGTGKK